MSLNFSVAKTAIKFVMILREKTTTIKTPEYEELMLYDFMLTAFNK